MKITILGSGTSCGVPQIGCLCEVCTSRNPKDKRLRCSVLIEEKGKSILIDCGPDFREQMLRVGFRPLDAVFITHEHYDHVGGLDDLRPYSIWGDVNVYAEKFCADHLRLNGTYRNNWLEIGLNGSLNYTFEKDKLNPQPPSGAPAG